MSRPPKAVTLAVSASGATMLVRESNGMPWRETDRIAFDSPADGLLPASFEAWATRTLAATRQRWFSSDVVIALAPSLCPGLLIDFGEMPLPARVREAAARRRFRESFGAWDVPHDVKLDERAVIGPSLAFAVPVAIVTQLRGLLNQVAQRSHRVMPLLAWGCTNFAATLTSGWLVIDDGLDVQILYIERGICAAVHTEPSTPHEDAFQACAEAVKRCRIRLGIAGPVQIETIKLVRLGGMLTARRQSGEGYQIECLGDRVLVVPQRPIDEVIAA